MLLSRATDATQAHTYRPMIKQETKWSHATEPELIMYRADGNLCNIDRSDIMLEQFNIQGLILDRGLKDKFVVTLVYKVLITVVT